MSGRDRLHRLVWMNQPEGLKEILTTEDIKKEELNAWDVRGNPPLILSIMLGRHECTKILLEHGASCQTKNKLGWLPIHEARSFGNRDILKLIYHHRRIQAENYFKLRSEKTIQKISEIDDFYMEMHWDFSSWIPFVSRFCPHDTVKIWKKGANFRADTTLKGFENLKWVRGNLSFIYLAKPGELGELYIVDWEDKIIERAGSQDRDEKIEERINFYLNTKIRFGNFKGQGITFNRTKSGVLGMGSGKTEMVGNYEADLYQISGLKTTSSVRSEHLLARKDKDKDRVQNEVEKVEDLLEEDPDAKQEEILEKVQKFEIGKKDADLEKMINETKENVRKFRESLPPPPSPAISFDEYFYPELHDKKLRKSNSGLSLASISNSLGFGKDSKDSKEGESKEGDEFLPLHVGREMSLRESKREFKATLWMSTSFPLFIEQLLPIIEILAPSNKNFETLKDFIDLKLPRGFPIKIEIPLFGVLTAKITSQNYELKTDIEDSLFELPKDFIFGEIKIPGA